MLANPNTLLTVTGVAWGIFETMQNQGSPATSPGSGSTTAGPAIASAAGPSPIMMSIW